MRRDAMKKKTICSQQEQILLQLLDPARWPRTPRLERVAAVRVRREQEKGERGVWGRFKNSVTVTGDGMESQKWSKRQKEDNRRSQSFSLPPKEGGTLFSSIIDRGSDFFFP